MYTIVLIKLLFLNKIKLKKKMAIKKIKHINYLTYINRLNNTILFNELPNKNIFILIQAVFVIIYNIILIYVIINN